MWLGLSLQVAQVVQRVLIVEDLIRSDGYYMTIIAALAVQDEKV